MQDVGLLALPPKLAKLENFQDVENVESEINAGIVRLVNDETNLKQCEECATCYACESCRACRATESKKAPTRCK